VRVFDVSDPREPKRVLEQKIGKQLNMVSQTWDGKRVYFTSSVLSRWDKIGEDRDQFLKAFHWDGKTLEPAFEIDFTAQALGRPHIMHFGAQAFGEGRVAGSPEPPVAVNR
jgi:selenium-binding protein 1